jgi:hypothetical protein
MNAVQRFKERTGKSFPTHGEVLKVAAGLGYRRVVYESDPSCPDSLNDEGCLAEGSSVNALT